MKSSTEQSLLSSDSTTESKLGRERREGEEGRGEEEEGCVIRTHVHRAELHGKLENMCQIVIELSF